MSEQKHSPEPWSAEADPPGTSWVEVRDAKGESVAAADNCGAFFVPEDARRIVAAVNAVATLPSTALEAGKLMKALDALRWLVSGAADGREGTQARLDGIEALKALGMAP